MEKPAVIHANRPTLAIHLLGPFRIAVNGAEIEERLWTRRKSKTLVKLLALQPHRQLHREQVMELLWPELDLEAAVNNLHKTIHAARRALEPELKAGAESGFIVTQDQQVILRSPGELWIDFQVFERFAAAALKSHDAAACESALELYGGDLLSEDLYEDWAVSRREQLRLLRQKLLRRLAQIHETNGHHQQAIESYQRLVAASPSDEEAHRHLMRLYALTGDRRQAMRQYQQLQTMRRRLPARLFRGLGEILNRAAVLGPSA
jgi:DNA-binding SARP family transcriptional activator